MLKKYNDYSIGGNDKKKESDKVVFEVHEINSLSNRFYNQTPLSTAAMLSIDDDLVLPCRELDKALGVWNCNKNVLVGFSPRLQVYDIITGR